MDPASAAIAFVGFAGSIVQITGAAIVSCHALQKFCRNIANANTNVSRLIRLLEKLEMISSQMQDIRPEDLQTAFKGELRAIWCTQSTEMEQDLRVFRERIEKLERSIKSKSRFARDVTGRLKTVFAEDETAKQERILATHVDTATFMLSLANR